MFWKAVCDNLGTIIGVIGSILGGVVGWWLNNLSRKGKISIFVDGINGKFQSAEGAEVSSLEEADNFYYNPNIEIYNSSSDAKIMRDIKIVFGGENKELLVEIPYDKAFNHSWQIHKQVKALNLPAKSTVSIELYGWINKEDLAKVCNSTKVFLYYKDENDKQQTKLLEVKDYKTYEFYKGEE